MNVHMAVFSCPVPTVPRGEARRTSSPPARRLVWTWLHCAPDWLPLRAEAAAMCSLDVTLGRCSQRAEALQCCLDWLREWLGVERAAVVAQAKGGLRVEAETRAPGPSAPQLHWPVVQEAFAAKADQQHASAAGPAPLAPN